MNDRICNDFMSFNCTIPPETGAPEASASVPSTLRIVESSPFFLPNCAWPPATPSNNRITSRTVVLGFIGGILVSMLAHVNVGQVINLQPIINRPRPGYKLAAG